MERYTEQSIQINSTVNRILQLYDQDHLNEITQAYVSFSDAQKLLTNCSNYMQNLSGDINQQKSYINTLGIHVLLIKSRLKRMNDNIHGICTRY